MVGFSLATPWGENKLSQICRSWRERGVERVTKKSRKRLAGARSFGALGMPT